LRDYRHVVLVRLASLQQIYDATARRTSIFDIGHRLVFERCQLLASPGAAWPCRPLVLDARGKVGGDIEFSTPIQLEATAALPPGSVNLRRSRRARLKEHGGRRNASGSLPGGSSRRDSCAADGPALAHERAHQASRLNRVPAHQINRDPRDDVTGGPILSLCLFIGHRLLID
jgi:hypothetical protein